MVDVNKSEAFLAVAEELHFGRAAKRLHMAQPPLSRLIRQLERELETVLFDRSTRKVSLTPQGEALLEPAREMVALARHMRAIARRADLGEVGRIRLGFAGASVNDIVGPIIRHLQQTRPAVTLELHSPQLQQGLMEKVLEGSLDLAIGKWDYVPTEIDSRVLAFEDVLIAMPEDHPMAPLATVPASALAAMSWIVIPNRSASSLPNRLHTMASAERFIPRITQVVPDSPTGLVLVGAGVGVMLTSSGLLRNITSHGIVYRRVHPSPPPIAIQLAWPRDSRNPALPGMLAICAEAFPGPNAVQHSPPDSTTTLAPVPALQVATDRRPET